MNGFVSFCRVQIFNWRKGDFLNGRRGSPHLCFTATNLEDNRLSLVLAQLNIYLGDCNVAVDNNTMVLYLAVRANSIL